MTKTIVAMFDDIAVARQVVEDLVNADFARGSISLITNDAQNQYSRYLDKDYVPRDDAVTAAQGAGFGAVVGALTGILAGLAVFTIPGMGLAIVAGPIAAGLTGAVAGAVTGGIVGALVKSGVPEDEAPYYAEGIRRGGTLISIRTSDVLRAGDIMNRYGAINIHERISLWRQDGWKGFDTDAVAVENGGTAKSPPEMHTAITTDTTTTRVTTTTRSNAVPVTAVPVITAVPVESLVVEEPPIDIEDTAESLPLGVPPSGTIIPDAPIAESMTAEPVLLAVEKEPHAEYEDAGQMTSRMLNWQEDRSKG